jgi:hypothetical protein
MMIRTGRDSQWSLFPAYSEQMAFHATAVRVNRN